MYNVIKNGETIAVIERPVYVKRHNNEDCYVLAKDENDATGIVVNGEHYNLPNKTMLAELETVTLAEFNAGKQIQEMSSTIDELIIMALEV